MGTKVFLICDAVGGSNSLLGKILSKDNNFIYYKTIATLFDSAGTVDKLFVNLDDTDDYRNDFLDTDKWKNPFKIHLQSFPGGSDGPFFSAANTFIEKEASEKENFQHKHSKNELLPTNPSTTNPSTISHIDDDGNFQKIRQGPSVVKLGCEIANEKGKEDCNEWSKTNSKMYKFGNNLKAVLKQLSDEDRKNFLFEFKRNGDHLQVLITHYLNWKNIDGAYHIFCSIDRLAIHFARLLKIPCILVNSEAGILKLYKGMDNSQKVVSLSPEKVEIMSLKNQRKKKISIS